MQNLFSDLAEVASPFWAMFLSVIKKVCKIVPRFPRFNTA